MFPGSDCAAHMSEECQNASLSVPRAMIGSILINAAMGLLALITFLFALPDLDAAINDPSGFPLVYVLNLAGRPNVTFVIIFFNLFILMVGNVAYQAATARQTFAFARDGGMPFSRWIGHVNPKFHLPVNAVMVTAAFTIILCVITLGSSDAVSNWFQFKSTYTAELLLLIRSTPVQCHLIPRCRWADGFIQHLHLLCTMAADHRPADTPKSYLGAG